MSTQNNLAGQPVDEQLLTAALRNADPHAAVSVESATGQLNVSTVLSEHEVLEILGGLGVRATPTDSNAEAGHQGGQCCGSCG
jgi:hypothetical protein